MARIAGVDLPNEKRIDVALTRIFGIGTSRSKKILDQADVLPSRRTKELVDAEVVRIRDIIEKEYKVEGDLRREVTQNIKRLMDLGCYRGLRHRKSLPVRGQRTSTNSRTRKGPKNRVANKKK